MHKFFNPLNPNSTFFGRVASYPFKNGEYITDKPREIQDLSEFFKFEEFEEKAKPVVAVLHKEPEHAEAPKTKELLTQLPKSWTIARIYEYADEMGIQIPDNIVKLADIKLYVEALASAKE